jgi:hypothetical protein
MTYMSLGSLTIGTLFDASVEISLFNAFGRKLLQHRQHEAAQKAAQKAKHKLESQNLLQIRCTCKFNSLNLHLYVNVN